MRTFKITVHHILGREWSLLIVSLDDNGAVSQGPLEFDIADVVGFYTDTEPPSIHLKCSKYPAKQPC